MQYLDALEMDPFMELAASNLMPALILSGKYSLGVEIGARLIKNIQNDIVYYNYAVSLFYTNRKAEAVRILKEAPPEVAKSKIIAELLHKIENAE